MRRINVCVLNSLLLGFGLVTGCGSDAPNQDVEVSNVSQPSQCGGTWDVQDVETYDGTLGVSQAFVMRHQLRVGHRTNRGHCTGTLISDDLFLSAGHCNFQLNDNVQFNFQYAPDGTLRPPRDFLVSEIVEQDDPATNGWDYAIVRLRDKPGREFGHAQIAPLDPAVGSLITIIQHPGRSPKVVHAGLVVNYPTDDTKIFEHQVDTDGASSGSGVLDTEGRLVGIHVGDGCDRIGSNSAERMSQLVQHSAALTVLARQQMLWQKDDGTVSIWNIENPQLQWGYTHGPYPDWTPVSYTQNRILWRHTSGQISLWKVGSDGAFSSYVAYGPYAGWTALNYANNRILWRHDSGQISLWAVDDDGNQTKNTVGGPFADWTALNYANNRILWKHSSGQAALWVLDDSDNSLSSVVYGPFAGWTPVNYANNEVFWRHESGAVSIWSVDRYGNPLSSSAALGPFAGWTAVSQAERMVLWAYSDRQASLWDVNSDGNFLSYNVYGPDAGWSPLIATRSVP